MKLRFLLCLVIVLSLVSCEYKADSDYYRELEPSAASIPLEINLNDVDPQDTIYILDVTRLTPNANTYGKSLLNVSYMLDDTKLSTSGNDIIIYPNELGDGKYRLTVTMTVSSGTGSLADKMKMEGCQGNQSWNIRVIKNFDPGLKLGFRKNAGGLLELYWETSYIPKNIFEKYEVSVGKRITVTDQDQKSAIFEDYVYGLAGGSVDLYIKCADGRSRSYRQSSSFQSPTPKLYFETLDGNHLRVSWDKPFTDARYELSIINYSQYPVVSTSETSVIVSPPPFTQTWNYRVKMFPKNSTSTETIYSISEGYNLGNRGIMADDVDYYGTRNKLLAVYGNLYAVDLNTFAQTPQIDMGGSGSYSKISCVPGSDKIAVKKGNSFFIYPNDTYINPVIVYRSDDTFRDTDFLGLTNNDRLFIVDDDATSCDVYDANTGALLFTFNIGSPASRSVSPDGKYFCCASAGGLIIYTIGASGIEGTTTLPGSYASALFNPTNPQQLIAKKGNDIQILMAPDFRPVYTNTATNSTLINIDPANGNILYYRQYAKQDSLHVIRTAPVVEPVFSIAAYSSLMKRIKLKGNLLMDNYNSYFLDISPYLKP